MKRGIHTFFTRGAEKRSTKHLAPSHIKVPVVGPKQRHFPAPINTPRALFDLRVAREPIQWGYKSLQTGMERPIVQ